MPERSSSASFGPWAELAGGAKMDCQPRSAHRGSTATHRWVPWWELGRAVNTWAEGWQNTRSVYTFEREKALIPPSTGTSTTQTEHQVWQSSDNNSSLSKGSLDMLDADQHKMKQHSLTVANHWPHLHAINTDSTLSICAAWKGFWESSGKMLA